MTTKSPRRIFPLLLAALSLVVGISLGVAMNRSPENANTAAASHPNPAEAKALETLQRELQTTLVLPSDFKQVPSFSLLDVNEEPLDENLFSGEWSIVFFGFTHCPDVCPITLTVMKDVVETLASTEVPQPQTIFITVDPKRDTPEIMKQYISYFNEEFIGVTGDLGAVHQLTNALGIVAAYTVREDNPEEYDVDHTASMLLIDPEGRMRGKFTAPHTADSIVSDYTTLVKALTSLQSASLN